MKTNKDLVQVRVEQVTRDTFNKIYDEIIELDYVYNIVFSVRDVHITTTKYEGDNDSYKENVQLNALIQSVDKFNIEPELLEKLDDKSLIIDQYLIDYLLENYSEHFQTEKAILQQKIIINENEYDIVGVTNQ